MEDSHEQPEFRLIQWLAGVGILFGVVLILLGFIRYSSPCCDWGCGAALSKALPLLAGIGVFILSSGLYFVSRSVSKTVRDRLEERIFTLVGIVLSLLLLFVLYFGVIIWFVPSAFLPWAYLFYLIFAVIVIIFGMLPRSTD